MLLVPDDLFYAHAFNDRADFEYKYSLIPRRCYNTKKLVWGKAVRGRHSWRSGDWFVFQDRWYHKDEAIVMLLRKVHGNI